MTAAFPDFRHFAPRRALPGSTAPALGPAIFFVNEPCQLCQVALSGPAGADPPAVMLAPCPAAL